MKLKYEVITTPDKVTGLIEQETFSVFNGTRERLTRQIMDTKEQGIRLALIQLGWTPPNA